MQIVTLHRIFVVAPGKKPVFEISGEFSKSATSVFQHATLHWRAWSSHATVPRFLPSGLDLNLTTMFYGYKAGRTDWRRGPHFCCFYYFFAKIINHRGILHYGCQEQAKCSWFCGPMTKRQMEPTVSLGLSYKSWVLIGKELGSETCNWVLWVGSVKLEFINDKIPSTPSWWLEYLLLSDEPSQSVAWRHLF